MKLLKSLYVLLALIAFVSFAQEEDENATIDLDQPTATSETKSAEPIVEATVEPMPPDPNLTYCISLSGDLSNQKFVTLQQSLGCNPDATVRNLNDLPAVVPGPTESKSFLFVQSKSDSGSSLPIASDIGLVFLDADSILNEDRVISMISQGFGRRTSSSTPFQSKPKPVVILLSDADAVQARKLQSLLVVAIDSLPPSPSDFGDMGLLPITARYNVTIVVTQSGNRGGSSGETERALLQRALSMATAMTNEETEQTLLTLSTRPPLKIEEKAMNTSDKRQKKQGSLLSSLSSEESRVMIHKTLLAIQTVLSPPPSSTTSGTATTTNGSAISLFLTSSFPPTEGENDEWNFVDSIMTNLYQQATTVGKELHSIICQTLPSQLERDEYFQDALSSSTGMQRLLTMLLGHVCEILGRTFEIQLRQIEPSPSASQEYQQVVRQIMTSFDRLVSLLSPYDHWIKGEKAVIRWQGKTSMIRLSLQQELIATINRLTADGMVKGYLTRPWRKPVEISIHTLFKPPGGIIGSDHRQDPLGFNTARDQPLFIGDMIGKEQEQVMITRSLAHKAIKQHTVEVNKKQAELIREMLMFPLSIKNPSVPLVGGRESRIRRQQSRALPTGPRDPNDPEGPERMIRWDISPLDEALRSLQRLKASSFSNNKKKKKMVSSNQDEAEVANDDEETEDEEGEDSQEEEVEGIWMQLQRRLQNYPTANVVFGYKQPKLTYKMR